MRFSVAQALFAAFGAFGNSLGSDMNTHGQLIPLGLEFRFAYGADVSAVDQYEIGYNHDQANGNDNAIPRHVSRFVDQVYFAGA